MADCALHAALAVATALGWFGLGSLVLAPVARTGDGALDAVNRLGVGALGFALLTFAAGWLGLLYAAAYIPLLALAAAVGVVSAISALRGVPLPRVTAWPRWHQALAALIALYIVLELVAACAPISSADALFYHAAAPAIFEEDHRIHEIPWIWHSYQPFTVEMLVLDGFLLWDSVQGAFAPLLLALGSLAATVGAGYRFFGRTVALLAGAILFAQPFLTWIATSTFVEPGLAFMVALAGWNVADFERRGRTASLVLAGTFAGGAAGMKYVGAAVAVAVALAAAGLLRRRLSLRHVLAFAIPAVALALPWYVKNIVLTGNPVYPFVFGGASEQATRAAYDSFEHYGHGRSLADLVLLPGRLLADAEAFDRGEFVSPLFLLFAPVSFLDRRVRRHAAVVFAVAALFVLGWFLGSQQARFLIPLMPAFAILAAVGVVALARVGRLGRLVATSVTAGALVLGFGVTLVYTAQFVSVAAGLQTEREFLLQKVSYFEGTDWLNRNLPRDARVAIGHVFDFHLERPYVALTADALPSDAGPEETRAFVRKHRLTHAAIPASLGGRAKQLDAIGARLVARVTVHPVVSRTRAQLGPPETMLVYALPRD